MTVCLNERLESRSLKSMKDNCCISSEPKQSSSEVELPRLDSTCSTRNSPNRKLFLKKKKKNQEPFVGAKFLIVDDCSLNRMVSRRLFESLGCLVDVVDSGDKCLSLLSMKGHEYTAVFLDLNMPFMNGFEVFDRIKEIKDPKWHKLPIIAYSTDSGPVTRERCSRTGMAAHIKKPSRRCEMSSFLTTLYNDGFC